MLVEKKELVIDRLNKVFEEDRKVILSIPTGNLKIEVIKTLAESDLNILFVVDNEKFVDNYRELFKNDNLKVVAKDKVENDFYDLVIFDEIKLMRSAFEGLSKFLTEAFYIGITNSSSLNFDGFTKFVDSEEDIVLKKIEEKQVVITPTKKALTLRPYQKNALVEISKALKEKVNRVILKIPTGGGKTFIASNIVKASLINNRKTLFICDRIELIGQTSERFDGDGIDHSIIQAKNARLDETKTIQVCSAQTIARYDFKYLDNPQVIIIDEVHTFYDVYKRLIEAFPNALFIGLTATPYTKGLGKFFDRLIEVTSVEELIEDGFLVRPTVYAPSKPDLDDIKLVGGDYNQEDLGKAVNQPKLIGDIVEHWFNLAYDKPTICFATNIEHSKAIVEAFNKRSVNAVHLDAYTESKERKAIIKAFKEGEIKVLSSVDVLSKGFDHPGAEVAILARPTKSLSLYIQQGGRVLRIADGKDSCLILDHAGNTEEHGFLTDEFDYPLSDMEKPKSKPVKKEKMEKVAKACPNCFFVKTTFICPNCNFEFAPKGVAIKDGELVLISKESEKKVVQSAKEILSGNTVKVMGELKKMCCDKGWKIGKAYFMFREIFGREPNKQESYAEFTEPSPELLGYIKHLNIRKAKSNYSK